MKCVPLKVYMLRCVPTAPSLHMLKLRSALNFDRTSYEFSFKTQSNLWETFFGGGGKGGQCTQDIHVSKQMWNSITFASCTRVCFGPLFFCKSKPKCCV